MDREYAQIRSNLRDIDEYIAKLHVRIEELECGCAEMSALRIKDREIIRQLELLVDAQSDTIESYKILLSTYEN